MAEPSEAERLLGARKLAEIVAKRDGRTLVTGIPLNEPQSATGSSEGISPGQSPIGG